MGTGTQRREHTPHLRALPEGCRRTEDKTDATLGEGTAERGHTARRAHPAHREAPRKGNTRKGGAILQRGYRLRNSERRPAEHLRGARQYAEPGPRHGHPEENGTARRRDTGTGSVEELPRQAQQREGDRENRTGGQVRPAGRLQEHPRKSVARRHLQRPQNPTDVHQLGDTDRRERSRTDRQAGRRGYLPGIRTARHRGKTGGREIHARAQHPHLRHLSGHADDGR